MSDIINTFNTSLSGFGSGLEIEALPSDLHWTVATIVIVLFVMTGIICANWGCSTRQRGCCIFEAQCNGRAGPQLDDHHIVLNALAMTESANLLNPSPSPSTPPPPPSPFAVYDSRNRNPFRGAYEEARADAIANAVIDRLFNVNNVGVGIINNNNISTIQNQNLRERDLDGTNNNDGANINTYVSIDPHPPTLPERRNTFLMSTFNL